LVWTSSVALAPPGWRPPASDQPQCGRGITGMARHPGPRRPTRRSYAPARPVPLTSS